jgi:hypothetical protein
MFSSSKAVSSSVASTTDPYFSSVSLLVSGEGTNGSQNNTFIDSSTNNLTVTRFGNITQGSVNPFNLPAPYSIVDDGGSLSFDGSGDYLNIATNAAFGFGTGDFTIEFWAYPTVNARQDWIDVTTPGSTRTLVYYTGTAIVFYSQPSNIAAITGPAMTLNTWQHIAVSKISGSTKMFINGTQVGSTYATSQNYGTTNQVFIGKDGGGTTYVTGLMSNVRIIKGTGLYSADFTPSTTPLTAVTNTSLLLSGTNAGIYDNAMISNFETVGNAQVSTSVKKYGTGSMYFDGTLDSLAAVSNPNLNFGTGDFTLECWVYFNVVNAEMTLINKGWQTPNAYASYLIWMTNAGSLQFNASSAGTSWDIANGKVIGTMTATTWTHIAVTRSGTTFRAFVNGVITSAFTFTSASSLQNLATQALYIGGRANGTSSMNGYLDDVRLTKGVARYTATFTPPTQPFPTS